MIHILPVLCLIGFAFFVEFRLQKEINEINKEIKKLKKKVNEKRANN